MSPGLSVNQAQGRIAVRDDNLYFEDLVLRTAESDLHASGVVEQYLRQPVLKLTATSEKFSLPELARVLPLVGVVQFQPAFEIDARGPLDRLAVDLTVRSRAGAISGATRFDLVGPRRAAAGTLNLRDLNLAEVFARPDLRSRFTGKTTFDLAMPPGGLDTMSGPFSFDGSRAAIAGYEAEDVHARGRLAGPRIEVDGRARAYGAATTVRGAIVRPTPGRALELDLRGAATGVDLRRVPANLKVPRLASDLTADWHLVKNRDSLAADAVLGASTIEGARFASGTTASMTLGGDRLEYSAKGAVTDLDLQRFGRALEVPALGSDRFASAIAGPFDVKGAANVAAAQGKTLETMTIDASGEAVDSRIFGGDVPRLAYTARLDGAALTATAKGTFARFDPAVLTDRSNLAGAIAGRLDVAVQIDDVRGPIAPETLVASGRVELADSTIGGMAIDTGAIEGQVNRGEGNIKTLEARGTDLHVTASGPVDSQESGCWRPGVRRHQSHVPHRYVEPRKARPASRPAARRRRQRRRPAHRQPYRVEDRGRHRWQQRQVR